MAGEDRPYTDWLHDRACQAPPHVCAGPIVVHHPTGLRASGRRALRAHDHYGVTLCDFAHRALHDLSPNGPFAGAKREDIRLFCDLAWKANRKAWDALGDGFVPDVDVPF